MELSAKCTNVYFLEKSCFPDDVKIKVNFLPHLFRHSCVAGTSGKFCSHNLISKNPRWWAVRSIVMSIKLPANKWFIQNFLQTTRNKCVFCSALFHPIICWYFHVRMGKTDHSLQTSLFASWSKQRLLNVIAGVWRKCMKIPRPHQKLERAPSNLRHPRQSVFFSGLGIN